MADPEGFELFTAPLPEYPKLFFWLRAKGMEEWRLHERFLGHGWRRLRVAVEFWPVDG